MLQTVVVTGAPIARPAQDTAEAITVINSSAPKDVGVVNVEQSVASATLALDGLSCFSMVIGLQTT